MLSSVPELITGTRASSESSPLSIEMPSGGVIKYSLIEFIKDLRHGLGSSITSQMSALSSLYSRYRTPVCVGDVYLIASMLWGQGMKPVLVATAKSCTPERTPLC